MHASFRRCVLAATLLLATPLFSAAPDQVDRLIETLFRSPEFEQGRLSPDGSYFAYIRQVKDQKVLDSYEFKTGKFYRLKPPGGADSRFGPGMAQHIGNFAWIGPDQLIIQDNIQNIGFSGLWVAKADLQKCRKLETGNQALVLAAALPHNPDTAYLTQVDPGQFFTPLWRLDKKNLSVHVTEPNPGRVIDWNFDQAGRLRLATVAGNAGTTSYLYRTPGGKGWDPVVIPNLSDPVTFDSAGTGVLLSYPGPEGRRQVQGYDFAAAALSGEAIRDPVYDLNPSVIIDPRDGATVGFFYEKEKPVFLWLNADYARTHAQLQVTFPGATVVPRGTLADGQVLFSVSADVTPPALYRFDSKKREIHLVIAAFPEAAKLKWAPMQAVSFPARDGRVIHGYLTLPPGRRSDRKVPLVALSHGGPEVRDTWGFDPEVQFLAALGYAVLQVNYRGSTGYGHDYALEDSIAVCEKSVDDVADGIRWAVAQGYADPARLAAYGGSYGGYISLGLATRYPDLLAATVGFAGVYDWTAQLKESRKHFSGVLDWRANYYIDPKTAGDRYRPFSPAFAADRVRCPVLLIHGGADMTVDIKQTNIMAKALRDAGKPVEVIKDAEGIHGLPNEEARRTFYRTLAAFLLKHAPPDAMP